MNPFAVKWNKVKDAECCCGCGEPFKKGDMIYPRHLTGAVSVHYKFDCALKYNDDSLNIESEKKDER